MGKPNQNPSVPRAIRRLNDRATKRVLDAAGKTPLISFSDWCAKNDKPMWFSRPKHNRASMREYVNMHVALAALHPLNTVRIGQWAAHNFTLGTQ